jgi:hypothetical protein
MDSIARVVRRYVQSFKFEPKEKKKTKVERLTKLIREQTGLSKSMAGDIADAVVRGRDLEALSNQKNWPIEDGAITGPSGDIKVSDLNQES